MDRVEAILLAMPATRLQIQEATSYGKSTVQHIIERLHAAGWIHVCGWDRILKNGTGKFVMRYRAGPGRDRECTLKPMARDELERRRRLKLLKTGDIAERRRTNRMRYYESRAKASPQTWLSALIISR